MAPKGLPKEPQRSPKGPRRLPKRPQEAPQGPKRLPKGSPKGSQKGVKIEVLSKSGQIGAPRVKKVSPGGAKVKKHMGLARSPNVPLRGPKGLNRAKHMRKHLVSKRNMQKH